MAAGDGLVSMTPSSVSHTGTSASINADGGVDFSAVTVVSLNGVFTSAFDHYVMSMWFSSNTNNAMIYARLRASGSDATGTNVTVQRVSITATSVNPLERVTSQTYLYIGRQANPEYNGLQLHLYRPAIATPTVARGTCVSGVSGGVIEDNVNHHSLSTAYDGISILTDNVSRELTGNVHVFGYEE